VSDIVAPYLEPDAWRAYQHQQADNDPSGNPQRLYVVYERHGQHWRTVAVYDEGYRGRPDALRHVSELPPVTIPKREYHDRLRSARSAGILSD
jgi:hypothetical protein